MSHTTIPPWVGELREQVRRLRIGIGEPVTLDDIERLLDIVHELDVAKAPRCECCS